jgi:hypothetical protein
MAALLLGAVSVSAAEEAKKADKGKKAEKKGEERLWPRGPKIEDLKTEVGLTDDQIAKAKEALAPIEKKNEELEAKNDVKAAEEAVAKAKQALKEAEEKAEGARDKFDLLTERKKAVMSVIPEDKKAKAMEVLHYKVAEPKKEKKEEKK